MSAMPAKSTASGTPSKSPSKAPSKRKAAAAASPESSAPGTPRRRAAKKPAPVSSSPPPPAAASPLPAATAPAPLAPLPAGHPPIPAEFAESGGKCPFGFVASASVSLGSAALSAARRADAHGILSSARLASPAVAIALVCLAPCIAALGSMQRAASPFAAPLLYVAALAAFAFAATAVLIPPIAELNKAADLFGIDINKRGLSADDDKNPMKIPEAVGIVPGTIFIICLTLLQLVHASTPTHLVEYTAALSTITFIVFLGFADDVLNLRWRYKLLLPPIASLSLLLAYAGSTTVIVPQPLRQWLGGSVDLGILYRLYMLLLTTFCSNAINIHAGLNGLEVGQSFVIGCSVLLHNLIELSAFGTTEAAGALAPRAFEALQHAHLFSAMVVMLFLAVSLALWAHNWFPSRVFVGDTFTYFAGVTFAVCGILGHFSKTLLLFFIPQILNFLYSLPQLVGIVHCPRHRLPRLNTTTGRLEAVPSHLNLINLALLIVGPMTEKNLCTLMLAFQIVCCAAGFVVRYFVVQLVY